VKITAVFDISEDEHRDTVQGIIELGGEITDEQD
jgi:hypothetical protein